jgi:hypothetical protein
MYTIENKSGNIITLLHMVKSAGTSIHQAIIKSNKIIHTNQRHASINNLQEQYKKYPRIIVIRKPDEWYKSFYRFFLGVEGYLSFMLNDPKDPYDGYIYPIEIDEFAKRSINFKNTLLQYPNKTRVFNNILRSQGNMHFITGYFNSGFSAKDPDTLNQFDMSLYEWFWKNVGGEDAIFIPMDRLDVIEKIFNIEIPHSNKTPDEKPKKHFTEETLKLINKNHEKFYNMINDFDENNLKTYQQWKNNEEGVTIKSLQ